MAEKKPALDDTIAPALEQIVNDAENDETAVPEKPKETEEINAAVESMKTTEETLVAQTEEIKGMEKSLTDSQKQYAQIVNPTEEFVVERLKRVKPIDKVKAVTEDNDPNGMLGKQGGYTAQVYFSSPWVKDEYGIYTGDVIEDGTDGLRTEEAGEEDPEGTNEAG